ncbi:MAG: hypothetical protein P9X24_01060 [Candidatus Hatepunaea meridiana]|nr:hypothetical protein [Candidatus Hatepunaea meridiana]
MSFNVLIIPEDCVNDQFILKPIIRAMMTGIGKRKANIQICMKPRLRGIADALDLKNLKDIIEQNGLFDLFLLLVDRDGDSNRKAKLRNREKRTEEILRTNQAFFAENAWQEIEVWILAGCKDIPSGWNWKEVREEINPKEVYYLPFAKQRNLHNTLGKGRKVLAEEAAAYYSRISEKCNEVAKLEQRISNLI